MSESQSYGMRRNQLDCKSRRKRKDVAMWDKIKGNERGIRWQKDVYKYILHLFQMNNPFTITTIRVKIKLKIFRLYFSFHGVEQSWSYDMLLFFRKPRKKNKKNRKPLFEYNFEFQIHLQ